MIEYPDKVNETELQARLWFKLLDAGIDARLQVKAERSRLDIVLFKDRIAKGIIECKCWSKSYIRTQRYQTFKNTKQYRKYQEKFRIPLFVCGCQASIDPAIHFAIKCCSNY